MVSIYLVEWTPDESNEEDSQNTQFQSQLDPDTPEELFSPGCGVRNGIPWGVVFGQLKKRPLFFVYK
eukprot:COSAG01_NODE_274_length_19734_cov_122.033512_19_plen_67_part_00